MYRRSCSVATVPMKRKKQPESVRAAVTKRPGRSFGEKQFVDEDRVQAAKPQREVVNHAGQEQESRRFVHREHDQAKDGQDQERSEVDIPDVSRVHRPEPFARRPEDVDPPPDDPVGGGRHRRGQNEKAAQQRQVPGQVSERAADAIAYGPRGEAGRHPAAADRLAAPKEFDREHAGECQADEAGRHPDGGLITDHVPIPALPAGQGRLGDDEHGADMR